MNTPKHPKWLYRWAMWRAIRKAQRNVWNPKRKSSRTDAMRAIKRFEEVNGIEFDPFNHLHLDRIDGCGKHENFFRAMRIIFAKYQTP